MAEERGMIAGDRVEARLDRLEQGLHAVREGVAELKGEMRQMDKRVGELSVRMSSVESLQKWAIGLIITSWFTVVGLIVTAMIRFR